LTNGYGEEHQEPIAALLVALFFGSGDRNLKEKEGEGMGGGLLHLGSRARHV